MPRILHLGVLAALAVACAVSAQDYPTKPVRILVPYPPGGASDVTARVLACPRDGGTPPDTACVFQNPSFEGVPQPNVSGAEFDAAPWQACDLTPDITGVEDSAGIGGQIPSDGKTYLYLGVATILAARAWWLAPWWFVLVAMAAVAATLLVVGAVHAVRSQRAARSLRPSPRAPRR